MLPPSQSHQKLSEFDLIDGQNNTIHLYGILEIIREFCKWGFLIIYQPRVTRINTNQTAALLLFCSMVIERSRDTALIFK